MLSLRQTKALEALLVCPSKADAAFTAGISPRTLTKYLADPEFKTAYKDAIAEVVGDATRKAQLSISPAIDALRAIVEDENEQSSIRVSASRALLEFGLKYTEFTDVLSALRDIERGL